MVDVTGGVIESVRAPDLGGAETRAYKESVVLSVPTAAGYVLDVVGQRISAVALGLRDVRPVRAWQEGGEIREENEARLRLLYRVAKTVASVYDDATARAFLRSSSPYLSDSAPVFAIAEGRDEDVVAAMRAFLEA